MTIIIAAIGAPKPQQSSFAFKCHRDNRDVFPVNALSFHPRNTFVTAGADGCLHTWDKDTRFRLAAFENFKRQQPISDAKFSPNVNIIIIIIIIHIIF
jgi:mRNA export factor